MTYLTICLLLTLKCILAMDDHQTADSLKDCELEVVNIENYKIVGHAREILTSETLDDCKDSCLHDNRNFTCMSGLYYNQTPKDNCILNSETRHSIPKLFIPETQHNITYFERKCGYGKNTTGTASIKRLSGFATGLLITAVMLF